MNDIRIHALLSRELRGQAQALLVIGSVDAGRPWPDLWVSIGRTDPGEVRVGYDSPRIEAARRLPADELRALDAQAVQGQPPFGLPDTPDRACWLARFDFSDHRGLEDLWLRCMRDAPDAPPFGLLAWRSRLDPARAAADGTTHAAFVPDGDPARADIAADSVVRQPLFELGVLLVHGIGPHRVRETLLRFGEPIVHFWMRLFREINRASAAELGPAGAAALKQALEDRGTRNRDDEDGPKRMLDRLVRAAPPAGPGAPAGQAPQRTLRCAGLRSEHTLFADQIKEQPSAALMRIMRVGGDGGLRDSHVLMAEAWWVSEAVRPTSAELFAWLRDAVPLALRLHVWALAKQMPGRPTTAEFSAPPAAADRLPPQALRRWVEWPLWLAKFLLLPPLYAALAMTQQLLLGSVGVIGLLPIAWLQRPVRALLDILMGTLGHSHALQHGPVRRNAIVSRVVAQLDWLSDRCRHVVVMSHSQGAEVSRLVFQRRRRREVKRWITFGAGIVPLGLLEYERLAEPELRRFARLMLGASSVTALAVAAGLLALVPGIGPAGLLASQAAQAAAAVAAALLAWIVFGHLYPLAGPRGRALLPRIDFRGRRSIMAIWHDYFASHDPVPAGSLLKELEHDLRGWSAQARPRETEVFNARLGLLDHTRYLQNVEQFIAPVGVDLLGLAGLSADPALTEQALRRATQSRDRYTWWHMALRSGLVAAALAAAAWLAIGAPQRATGWLDAASAAVHAASSWTGVPARLWSDGVVGAVLADLWPLAALGVAYAASRTLLRVRRRRAEDTLMRELAAAYLERKP